MIRPILHPYLTAAVAVFFCLVALNLQAAPLLSAEQLHARMQQESLVILDVRSSIDGGGDRSTFEQGHIPGSIYSNYNDDGWRENRNGVAGLLPPIASLERLIGSLGIRNQDHVVIVPAGTGPTDFGSAARIYWTFKLLGHEQVSLLNGGFRGWQQAGFDIASGPALYADPVRYVAEVQPQLLTRLDQVIERLESRPDTLVDARPADFYNGISKAGPVRVAGTLPGAMNFEHQAFLTETNGVWLLDETLLSRQLASAGLPAEDLVTFCNTGHWAATDWFALSEVAGVPNVSLYDGSMSEWASDADRVVQVPKRGIARLLARFN